MNPAWRTERWPSELLPSAHPGLFIVGCAALAGALFVFGQLLGAAPTGEGRRLGLRGLKRERALRHVPGWAWLEPCVRWLGARLSGVISDGARRDASRRMALGGDVLGLLPEEAFALSLMSGFVGLLVGIWLGRASGVGNPVIVAAVLAGVLLPQLRISSAGALRSKLVNRRLPYAIDLLALSMGAGLDFPGSVRQVIEKSGNPEDPLVEELSLLLQSLQLGRTRRQALEELAERVPSDAVVEFVGSVVQAELRGNPVVEVLRIQAEISRRKRSVRAEELAAKAGVAMMGPLALVFIAILIVIIAPMLLRLSQSGF